MAKGVVFGGLNSGGGSNIKSIQRGLLSLDNAASPRDITINSVNKNNSIVRVSLFVSTEQIPIYNVIGAQLTTNTNVRLQVNAAAFFGCWIIWEVIEFENVKSRQEGVTNTAGQITNITITAVDPLKSLVFLSQTSTSTTNGAKYYTSSVEFKSNTSIEIRGDASKYYWQVIEFK